MTFISVIGIFIMFVPCLQATIRVVPFSQRSFALGIQSLIVRAFGMVPGPVMYGTILDWTCLYRGKDCDGQESSCSVYDNEKMSRNFFTATILCQGATLVLLAMAYWTYQ